MYDNYSIMKFKKVIFFTIFITVFLLLSSAPVSADHATCDPDSYTGYPTVEVDESTCDELLDWWTIFEETEISDTAKLSDTSAGFEHRLLFMNAELFVNEDVYQRAVDTGIMAYEGHTTYDDTTIPDGSLQKNVDFNRNAAFSTSGKRDFRADRITISNLTIPENTNINLHIKDSEGNPVKSYILRPEDSVEGIFSRDITVVESALDSSYQIEATLERDNLDVDSPKIGDSIVLRRKQPEFRYFNMGYSEYPEIIDSYQEHTYLSNYNNGYSSSDDQTMYSPAYSESNFRHDSLKDTEYTYNGINMVYDEGGWVDFGGTNRPIKFAHVNIDKIEPSVNFPDGEIGSEWGKIIDKDEGDVYITYGATRDSIPLDGQDYTGGASVGDKEWSYSYTDLDYVIELVAKTPDYNQVIGAKSKNEAGAVEISYSEGELPDNTQELVANVEIDVEYDRSISEWEEEECEDDEEGDCGITLEYSHTESMYYSTKISDNQPITRFAQDDGPGNDKFDIKIANYPDETRIYVDRNLSALEDMGSDGFSETRWTNIKSEGISKTDNFEIYNRDYPDKKTYNRYISLVDSNVNQIRNFNANNILEDGVTDDMDVRLDVWVAGDMGSDNEVEVSIDENEIGSFSTTGSDGRNDFTKIVTGQDITDVVEGKKEFNLFFELDNSDYGTNEDRPLIEYRVTADLNKTVDDVNSRWNYLTFRDARWDIIYEIPSNCDSIWVADCFQYGGRPPADSNSYANYPSGALPIHTHLVPTTNSLETDIRNDQLNHDINIVEYPSIKNSITAPLKSPYCPKDLRRDDNARICAVPNSVLADEDIEYEYLHGDLEYTTPLSESLEGPESLKRLIDAPSVFKTNDILDYRPTIDDEVLNYREPSEFEIVTDFKLHNFSVSGNATWTYNDIETDNKWVGHTSKIEAEVINKEQLTESYVSELESKTPDNNIIKTADELGDNEYQLKVRFADKSNVPISTIDRNTDEKLSVQRADKTTVDISDIDIDEVGTIYDIDGSDVVIGETKQIDTNEKGMGYMTIYKHPDDEIGKPSVEVEFNSMDDWWNAPEDIRLIADSEYESLKVTNQVPSEDEEVYDPDETPFMSIIMGMVGLIGSIFFILALSLRVYPWSNTTTLDLIRTATEPFSDELIQAIEYLIVVLVFMFIFIYFGLALVSAA